MKDNLAVKKLTACMERMFTESSEARKALREWLDELDQKKGSKSVYAPSITIATASHGDISQTSTGTYYQIRAKFNARPEDYGWDLEKLVLRSCHAIYEKSFPFGTVLFRYYFTTGTVQLVYLRSQHPDYTAAGGRKKAKIVENFRLADETGFLELLQNAPNHFGEGYLKRPEPAQA